MTARIPVPPLLSQSQAVIKCSPVDLERRNPSLLLRHPRASFKLPFFVWLGWLDRNHPHGRVGRDDSSTDGRQEEKVFNPHAQVCWVLALGARAGSTTKFAAQLRKGSQR